MTTLTIEQGNNIEIVSYAVILKLYETALNSTNVTLSGNLQCEHCFENAYNYLTGYVTGGVKRFPDLLINVTDGKYLVIADPVIDKYWKNSTYGDGVGITLASAASVTGWPRRDAEQNTGAGNQRDGGKFAFYNDKTITSFDELGLFSNLTIIPSCCFRDSSILSINLSNITTIMPGAFHNSSISGVVNAPKLNLFGPRDYNVVINGITKNESGSNFESTNITQLNIGSEVIEGLKVSNIPTYLVYNCPLLESVTGLSEVTTISAGGFRLCPSLASLSDLNDNVSSIEDSSFQNDSSLLCINITNCSTIGSSALNGCSNLIALDTNDTTKINDNTEYTLSAASIGNNAFQNTDLTGKTIIMPNITKTTGSMFRDSKLSKFIGANVTEIAGGSFYGCSQLQEVLFGNVTKIESTGAFYNCSNLTTIKFGNLTNDFTNLQEIGLEAFFGCGVQFPTNLSLPNLTSIGNNAFRGHTEIQSITNLGSITSLVGDLFRDCSISSVTLPNTLTSFLLQVFNNSALTYILVPEGVTDAGFGQCIFSSGLFRYAEFPSTVTTMTKGFHRSFETSGNSSLNTVMCVIKATTPPTVTYYLNLVLASLNGASRLRGIYVPDGALSAYQSASDFWSYSEVQSLLKPISQLETDSPTYWAIYQAGLSNS